ncbi:MAG: hypothetical protein M1813_005224 [Trichoglossum hirsutum]|nr:MAG: hypothetical protein M1813_005224 [Trichoglossum hirsutum]
MAQEIRNVIIVGASGNLGRPVLATLMSSNLFYISILTRPSTPRTNFPPSLPIHVSDYTPSSLVAAFTHQDAVISLIAGSAVLEQKKMIDAAVQAGVKRFVVSEWGADTRNDRAREVVGRFAKKVDVVQYARSREGMGNGAFSWSAVVTGPWFDRSLRLGLLGFSIPSHHALIHSTGSTQFTTTTLSTITTSLLYILTTFISTTKNRYIYLSSFTTTQNEILEYLRRHKGDQAWTVERIESQEAIRRAKEKVDRGEPGAVRELVTAQTFSEGRGGVWGGENAAWGIAGETLDNVVGQVARGV